VAEWEGSSREGGLEVDFSGNFQVSEERIRRQGTEKKEVIDKEG